ncbi:MAG TPA: hypothetical protein VFQ24_01750 [Terriglobia bacterium]|nr:hypothetical protein [Terriglobia bacterium]
MSNIMLERSGIVKGNLCKVGENISGMIGTHRRWHGNIIIRRPRDRWSTKPMTVTIAALCDAVSRTQTGNFIMCADTLISYSDASGTPVSGNPEGTKLYDLPHGFYMAIAGDISQSHQVVSYLHHQMTSFQASDPNLVDLIKLSLDRTAEYVRMWMRREVLADYGVSLDEFLGKRDLQKRDDIAGEIRDRVISTQVTVAGFTQAGKPVLFFTDCVNIQEQTNPGFFCGGAGANAALHWLNLRKQNCFMSTQRTWYHIREAKQFSEVCPVVGGLNHTILLRAGKPMVNVSAVKPLLNAWFQNMYPRTTDCLEEEATRQSFISEYEITD